MRLCTLFAIVAVAAVTLTGCEGHDDMSGENPSKQDATGVIVLGEKLANPYALANMREAGGGQIEANCLYVRLLPETEQDVIALQQLELNLYDHPLDYEIKEQGYYYHDPSLPEDAITWQYAVVPVDFRSPTAMKCEVLEECYIPDDIELERRAYLNAGYSLPSEGVKGGLSQSEADSISGNILIFNDSEGKYVGLKGVKVSCHLFMKEYSCYTDGTGHYTMANNFLLSPARTIVYDNVREFSIWKDLTFVNAVRQVVHDLDEQCTTGICNDTIMQTDDCWSLCVINNSAYEYYDFCLKDTILPPPDSLKIWVWSFVGSSSASMIRRVSGYDGGTVTKFAGRLVDSVSVVLPWVADALPDLTVGVRTSNNRYMRHYTVTWHELTHSSHFAQAGADVWAKYIDYIVEYGAYGDGKAKTEGMYICDLGESWAYANERYCKKICFGDATSTLSDREWFYLHYQAIYNVLNEGVLTRKQMYDCLTGDVKSYDDFRKALVARYPEKTASINKLMM